MSKSSNVVDVGRKQRLTAGSDRSDRALANAAGFLQPLADLAAKRFGAAVSILMAVPIGTNKGKIELRR